MNLNELLANYIYKHCLEQANDNTLFYGKRPGDRYRTQYYLSRLLYDVDMRFIVAKGFMELVDRHIGHWDFQITGREWSAIPLITSLQDHVMYYKEIHLNAFMIKRQRKTYGIHNFYEGKPNNLPVLIVDDLCNSTDSFVHCHNVLKYELKLEMLPFIFAVLNKHGYKKYSDSIFYDKYLGPNYKALFLVDGDDINEARIRSTNIQSVV